MNTDTSWQLMVFMALVLGIRHGFDLDHLATIDALTRTVRDNRLLSKMVGFLFSLGHGLVVILVSLIVGGGLVQAHVPEWLEGCGNWISIFFLVVFGALNLWNVFQSSPSTNMPVGIKSFIARKITGKKSTPFLITMIGALFAFSFDTVSQIALFSISASLLSGWLLSGILGVFFMLGMMMSDGLNGLFVSTLIQRADRTSIVLSRGIGLTISMFSLIIGFMSLLKIFH
ncbi:MAG: DNA repair protein [Chlamydiae bacterium]|nr:DNA repair protein [Chlamydiota bacterium]